MKLTKTKFMTKLKGQLTKLKERGSICLYLEDVFDNYDNPEVFGMFRECKKDILALRDVDSIEVISGSWTDTVAFYAKPCKEYTQLIKYLQKCHIQLKPTDICVDDISGKRSRMNCEHRSTFAHSPRTCTNALNLLKNLKASTSTVKCEKKRDVYFGDRFNSYGEDRECEWNGYIRYYVVLTVLTPSGRVRGKVTISI